MLEATASSTALANSGPGATAGAGFLALGERSEPLEGSRPLELAWSLWIGNVKVSSTEAAI